MAPWGMMMRPKWVFKKQFQRNNSSAKIPNQIMKCILKTYLKRQLWWPVYKYYLPLCRLVALRFSPLTSSNETTVGRVERSRVPAHLLSPTPPPRGPHHTCRAPLRALWTPSLPAPPQRPPRTPPPTRCCWWWDSVTPQRTPIWCRSPCGAHRCAVGWWCGVACLCDAPPPPPVFWARACCTCRWGSCTWRWVRRWGSSLRPPQSCRGKRGTFLWSVIRTEDMGFGFKTGAELHDVYEAYKCGYITQGRCSLSRSQTIPCTDACGFWGVDMRHHYHDGVSRYNMLIPVQVSTKLSETFLASHIYI